MAGKLMRKIETCKTRSSKEMFRNVSNVTEKKYCTAGGCWK